MQLFYQPKLKPNDEYIDFDKDESRHIVKVLRKRSGDSVHLTNGAGWIFDGVLEVLDQKHCRFKVISAKQQAPRSYRLHLAVAPTKSMDRFEWFLEKATEIGIDEITPLICQQSERRNIKPERLQRILQSAMKQSLQAYLPKLNQLTDFASFIASLPEDVKVLIAHCDPSQRQSLKKVVTAGQAITIMIGPEGDFSREEILSATEKGIIPVHMGDSRLRTETAAIVACQSVAFINQ